MDGSLMIDGNSKNVCATIGTSIYTMDSSWGCVTLLSQNEGSDRGCGYVFICRYDLGACDI